MANVYHPDLDSQGLIGSQPTGSNEGHLCPAEQSALAAVLAAKPAVTARSTSFAAAGPSAEHTGLKGY